MDSFLSRVSAGSLLTLLISLAMLLTLSCRLLDFLGFTGLDVSKQPEHNHTCPLFLTSVRTDDKAAWRVDKELQSCEPWKHM